MVFKLNRDKVYFLRQKKGFTSNVLAANAGVSIGTVRAAENGQPIREGSAYKIAKALGVVVTELM